MYKRSVSGVLRYTARLVLAGSIALAALGCARTLAPIPDVPRRQGKALRVFVDNQLPRGILARTTVGEKTGFDPFLALANDLQTALEQAGYVVVRDPEQPHDVTARLTSDTHWENLSDTTGRYGSYGTTKLQFFASSPGGRSYVLDEVSVTVPVSDGGAVLAASFSMFVSRRLVEQVELSTNIATMSPAGIAPRPAVASADPVPTPSTPALTPPPSARAAADSAPPPAAVLTSASPQPSAWALIIGIEKYRDVPPPTGARSDAESFAQMARHTLGIPESHIVVALDDRASKSDIEKHLDWLKANVPAGARIYFYFSGHGAPEPSKGTSYLFPFDGDPRFLEKTALPMGDVLRLLSQTKAREVLAVVDACFSGAGGRSVLPPGARALVRVQTAPVTASVALFSAASGAEISGPAPGGSSGLFTQHVLEGLGRGKADMDGDGQVSLQELSDYVRPRVARDAKRDNRDQNPSLTVGNTVGSADKFIVEWGLAAAR